MTEARRVRAPWVVWGVEMLVGAATALFAALNWSSSNDRFFPLAELTMVLGYSTVGALIVSRDRSNAVGWLLMAVGISLLLAGFSTGYIEYAYVTNPGSLPAGSALAIASNSFWLPTFVAVILLALVFPTGRVPGPRWRRLPWVIIGLAIVASIAGVLHPGPVDLGLPRVHLVNPIGVEALKPVLDIVASVGWIGILLIGGPLSIVALILRYRRSGGEERQQLRWLVYTAATTGIVLVLSGVLGTILGEDFAGTHGGDVLFAVGFASIGIGVPVAIGIAVMRYRLYDLDVVIKKTLIALVLTLLIGGPVLLVVAIASQVLIWGIPTPVPTIAGGVVLGMFVIPLVRFARRIAERIVYGRRATSYEVLAGFTDRMAETYATDDVLPRMAQILREASGASDATVWLRIGPTLRPVGSAGDPENHRDVTIVGDELPALPGLAVEVRHQGELLGALTARIPANDPLDAGRERLIRDLASQAGLVLRNVRLIEELRASRQRLVAAQDEERRKIERNIHDGAQQQLVALAVKLRLAENALERDPATARGLITQLQGEANDALENLRDLARGIYPPLLAEEGLAVALVAQARKSPVPVVVSRDGIGRYPQDVEAGVYFCVLEAIQNVAKYAEASRVDVELRHDQGRLWFAVRDDGVGFDPATAPRGSGLQGMADRIDAVGGSFSLRSRPGAGTQVSGSVPVSSSP